jgi:hypothetical protein
MRKVYMKVNIQANIVVNANDDVTTQEIEDGLRLTLETEGADLEDTSVDWIELDVTDSK